MPVVTQKTTFEITTCIETILTEDPHSPDVENDLEDTPENHNPNSSRHAVSLIFQFGLEAANQDACNQTGKECRVEVQCHQAPSANVCKGNTKWSKWRHGEHESNPLTRSFLALVIHTIGIISACLAPILIACHGAKVTSIFVDLLNMGGLLDSMTTVAILITFHLGVIQALVFGFLALRL